MKETFYNRVIEQTDWRALQRQKMELLNVAKYLESENGPLDINPTAQRIYNILSFIGRIQNAAVDIFGKSEDEVFDGMVKK